MCIPNKLRQDSNVSSSTRFRTATVLERQTEIKNEKMREKKTKNKIEDISYASAFNSIDERFFDVHVQTSGNRVKCSASRRRFVRCEYIIFRSSALRRLAIVVTLTQQTTMMSTTAAPTNTHFLFLRFSNKHAEHSLYLFTSRDFCCRFVDDDSGGSGENAGKTRFKIDFPRRRSGYNCHPVYNQYFYERKR